LAFLGFAICVIASVVEGLFLWSQKGPGEIFYVIPAKLLEPFILFGFVTFCLICAIENIRGLFHRQRLREIVCVLQAVHLCCPEIDGTKLKKVVRYQAATTS